MPLCLEIKRILIYLSALFILFTLRHLRKTEQEKIKVLNLTSAKDILRKYYLPDQIKDNKISVYYTKNNKYTTKTIYYKQRENKFKVLDESEEMKNLNKENINDSAYSLRSKYPQFTFKQIYGYLYRKLV